MNLEERLKNARYNLNRAINKSFKTGIKSNIEIINIYSKNVKELEQEIKNNENL